MTGYMTPPSDEPEYVRPSARPMRVLDTSKRGRFKAQKYILHRCLSQTLGSRQLASTPCKEYHVAEDYRQTADQE